MNVFPTLKLTICVILSLFIFQNVFAVPARSKPLKVMQPDGSMITLYVKGDERFHTLVSEQGYRVLEKTTGGYVYAIQDGTGNYIPSDFPVRNIHQHTGEELLFLQSQQKITDAVISRNRRKAGAINGGILPGKFPPRVLVILAEFQNVSILNYEFVVPDPQQTFSDLFNQEGYAYDGATGSVKDYFRDNSLGLYEPEFTVTGPVKLPRTKSYYGTNVQGVDKAPGAMIYDACVALAETGTINFSDFDSDGDGEVDVVIVIYSGLSEADGAPEVNIWPIAGTLQELNPYEEDEIYPLMLDGVLINRFIASSELRGATGTDITGVGTVIHEMGHVLGLPDLYNTVTSNGGLLGWSLMANGTYLNEGRTPPALSAFEREALGWGSPVELEIAGEYVLSSIETNHFYRINSEAIETEYFLLENRQQTGWDSYLEGHGMLIYHIDLSDPDAFYTNRVNADEAHPYVAIKVADGVLHQANYSGDPFPGTTGKNSFGDDTSPSSRLWDGTPLDKPVSDITETAGKIRFQFENHTSSVRESHTITHYYVANQMLYIETESICPFVELYNGNGMKLGHYVLTEGRAEITLSPGNFYILKIDSQRYKVIL